MANPFARVARLQRYNRMSLVASGFSGASRSRLFHDWAVGAFHPDREIRPYARTLRARARDLVKNNDYAAGIVESFADNLIGATGIVPKPVLRTDRRTMITEDVRSEIETGWSDWNYPENASLDGADSWMELERLLVRTWVTDGEFFVRHWRGEPNPYGYSVEIIDADLLDENYNEPAERGRGQIRQGIEFDERGKRPVAYWFWKEHPQADWPFRAQVPEDRVRVPAEEVIHWFIKYRPGQTRGYSLFAPVLTRLKMIDGLTEAELVASRLAAAKMGFITNNHELAVAVYAERLENLLARGEELPEPETMDVAPGLIDELMPGQGFEGFDPTHPNTAFEPFLKVMLRGVARGFGMSYLTATGDVSAANYSSMRAGLLPERARWRTIQRILGTDIHRLVYRTWLPMAMLRRAVRLPSRDPSKFHLVEWRAPGWKWVDPLKDAMGSEYAISLGVDSRSRIAAERGTDFETVVEEIEREQKFAKRHGVDVGGVKRATNSASAANDGDRRRNGSRNGNGNGDDSEPEERHPDVLVAARNRLLLEAAETDE